MNQTRIHRATSADGTEIAGRVYGKGPPLVLIHGALEDGDTCWASMIPRLEGRFTCYAMSVRGRGLSGHDDDLSTERLMEDVVAFVDSVGEPVGVVGESDGGARALGAAARCPSVAAVAVHEPTVPEVQGEDDRRRFEGVLDRIGELVAGNRLTDAVMAFADLIGNDDERTALSGSEEVEGLAANVRVQYAEFRQFLTELKSGAYREVSPTRFTELRKITAPVLMLYGSKTALRSWFEDGMRHIAAHVRDTRVRELSGSGHFGTATNPDGIADELIRFFGAVPALMQQTAPPPPA
jgi:pimeloyl-ACP methyl ester carboxylesterase